MVKCEITYGDWLYRHFFGRVPVEGELIDCHEICAKMLRVTRVVHRPRTDSGIDQIVAELSVEVAQ